MRRLTKNAARCRDCGTLLESKHRHDYRSCPCGNAVDGGLDYEHRFATREGALEELSEYAEEVSA